MYRPKSLKKEGDVDEHIEIDDTIHKDANGIKTFLRRFLDDSKKIFERFSEDSQQIFQRFSEDSQKVLSRFSADYLSKLVP